MIKKFTHMVIKSKLFYNNIMTTDHNHNPQMDHEILGRLDCPISRQYSK